MTTPTTSITDWMTAHLPSSLYLEPPSVQVDRDEILVVGPIAPDETGSRAEAEQIASHREATRDARVAVAREAEATFGRKVSWGARCGETQALFSHLASPVMTRLRQPERALLDLLVEAGVARSRSEATAWCVRLVAEREGEWLGDLHDALAAVREARTRSPLREEGA